MWVGIPYTRFGYPVTIPSIPRMVVFCLITSLLYIALTIPQTMRLTGSLTELERFDDIDSHDKYYLLAIHSGVFGLLMYLLLNTYNPYVVHHVTHRVAKRV